MKKNRMVWLVILGLLLTAQFIPVRRTNPAGEVEISAPAAVRVVLERSCYDCHSNRTKWPWYSSVAPVSWLVAHDVNEGRGKLNFSRWGDYSAKDRARLAEDIAEEVSKGAMPMKTYLAVHRGAKVSRSEAELLRAWSRAERAEGRVEDAE